MPSPPPSTSTISLSAGGRIFTTLLSTLEKSETLKALIPTLPTDPSNGLPFLDVDPKVFAHVMHYLRTGDTSQPRSVLLAKGLQWQLKEWKLLPQQRQRPSEAHPVFPNVLVCQLSDQFQQDAGVKRHSITVTYGADGLELGRLARRVRKDLKTQLASTYWQMHKIHERACFFQCTKIPNGTADLLMTTLTQQVIGHTERRGYVLDNSYVTMTPDPGHVQVRMVLHVLVFKRRRAVDPSPDLDEDTEETSLEEAEKSSLRGEPVPPPHPGAVPFVRGGNGEGGEGVSMGGGGIGPTPPKVIARRIEKIWPDRT